MAAGGDDENGVKSTGAGGVLQVNFSVVVLIWYKLLGGDGGNSKITIEIPSSVFHTDCGDDGVTCDKWGVGMISDG